MMCQTFLLRERESGGELGQIIRRHALRALLLAKSLLSNRCCLCSTSFDGIQLLVSKYPCIQFRCEPLVKWSSMTSRPMAPLWVVQLLPTSPEDPISRCDQNETQWPLLSTCANIERGGSRWDWKGALHGLHSKDVRVNQLWVSSCFR